MPWWAWVLVGIAGSFTFIETQPELAGVIVSDLLKKKLGKVGGARIESTFIVRVLVAFLIGLRRDNLKKFIAYLKRVIYRLEKQAKEEEKKPVAKKGLTGIQRARKERRPR